MNKPAIYIMASKKFGTLYVGVTSDIVRRVFEHKNDLIPGFTSQYGCKTLVYYFFFETMSDAIFIEKKLKKGSRMRKVQLIEASNPEWKDLYQNTI